VGEHFEEVEFGHYVDGDAEFGADGDEECLAWGVLVGIDERREDVGFYRMHGTWGAYRAIVLF
jgi:hypothetical protein